MSAADCSQTSQAGFCTLATQAGAAMSHLSGTVLDRDSFRSTFNSWTEADESLDAQLSESLVALEAYQSNLDAWQQQLAVERAELAKAREAFELEQRAAAEAAKAASTNIEAELLAARERAAEATASLSARTEEVQVLEARQAELTTDLQSACDRENQVKKSLDEAQHLLEEERLQRAEEVRALREALEQRPESGEPAAGHSAAASAAKPVLGLPRATNTNRDRSSGGAVLGSIVEQFGKLRQQRAVDRDASRKAR